MPDGFCVSDAVRAWAAKNKFTDLDARMEAFKDYALSNDKQCADWDAAFRQSIRGDWAHLNDPNAKPKPKAGPWGGEKIGVYN